MGILMEVSDVTVGNSGYRQAGYAMAAPREYYTDTVHTIAIKARETEFGSIVEPIPVTLTYKQLQSHNLNGYRFPAAGAISSLMTAPRLPDYGPSSSVANATPVKEDLTKISRAPPKKKWIRDYLEEEPKSPVSLRVVSVARSNGVVRPVSPAPAPPAAPAATPEPPTLPLAAVPPPRKFSTSHKNIPGRVLRASTVMDPSAADVATAIGSSASVRKLRGRLRPTQIPSPPSVGSSGSGSGSGSGSAPRAGTREVHNKLEKNRRAHLKECFELLKRQLPATPDDKKTSNLSILGSAIRYIQVLRRKERECEHEMERLAREKIAAQQRLAALKREVSVRAPARSRTLDTIPDDKEMDERVNGHVLGISMGSPPRSPPQSLNLSTKLRALPVQITPTTSQPVIRSTFGARHNTLTLTTLTAAEAVSQPNGVVENGVTNALSTLVHPAQIHLPISQVVSSGGLVVGPATLQLLSAGGGLRVLPSPLHANGVTSGENNRIPRTENGIISPTPGSATDGVVVTRGVTPLVVSQPAAHLLHTHTLTHKMVESQLVKGSVSPLTVSAQYLSTTIVKPVVVVSSAHTT